MFHDRPSSDVGNVEDDEIAVAYSDVITVPAKPGEVRVKTYQSRRQ
jgi:hypothetical protein